MKSPFGFGVAVLVTASFAVAGGDDDKKNGKSGEKKNGSKTEAATPLVDGWSGGPGKGLTYSSDMFSLTLRNRGQVQFNYNDNKRRVLASGFTAAASDTAGFDVRRARTSLSGHIWSKDTTYKLQTDWVDGTSVKDLWVDWRFYNTEKYDLGVRFGQQKIAFGNEWRTSSGELEFVDRALATRTFSNVRSRGATLHGDMGMGGDGGNFGWSISAFNTELAAASRNAGEDGDSRSPTAAGAAKDYNDETDDRLNWSGEFHWSSKAKAALGASQGDNHDGQSAVGAGFAYYFGSGRRGFVGPGPAFTLGPAVEVETDSANLYATWKSGTGIAASGEYFVRAENSVGANAVGGGASDSTGFQLACTWVAAPVDGQNQWGAGLRYSEIDLPDGQLLLTGGLLRGSANGGSNASELEAVVNMFHHGHNLKTQLGVTWQTIDPGGTGKSIDSILVSLQNTFVF
jgi:Phosphate-selective porin O and P